LAACRRAGPEPSRSTKLTWGEIMAGMAAILLLAGSGRIGAILQRPCSRRYETTIVKSGA
jgi:choline-glycine betaine transporter